MAALKIVPAPPDESVVVIDYAGPTLTHNRYDSVRNLDASIVDTKAVPLPDEAFYQGELIRLVLPFQLAFQIRLDPCERSSV